MQSRHAGCPATQRPTLALYYGIITERERLEAEELAAALAASAAESGGKTTAAGSGGKPTAAKKDGTRILEPIILYPVNITQLPSDFSDPAVLSDMELEKWVKANKEHIDKLELGPRATDISHRGILQYLSGVSFENETAEHLGEI
jgi:hypothetical protein